MPTLFFNAFERTLLTREKSGGHCRSKKPNDTERDGMTAPNTSNGFTRWLSTMKSLILRIWYLLLGALIAALTTECVHLRKEVDELSQVAKKSLEMVERTNSTSVECLQTLSDVRRNLNQTLQDTKIQSNGYQNVATYRSTESVLAAGSK
jgi:hypothetical protein